MEKAERNQLNLLRSSPLRWLWQVIRGQRRYIAWLLFLQILLSLAGVIYSLLFRELVDSAAGGQLRRFSLCFLSIVVLTVFRLGGSALNRRLEESAKSRMENTLKKRLFDTLLRRDYAAVTAVHSGEWMNRLTSDTVVTANALAQVIPNAGGMLFKILGALTALLILEPLFGTLILPGGLVLLLMTRAFRPLLKRLHNRIQESDGVLRVFLQEQLDNLLVVTTFSQEDRSGQLAEAYMDCHRQHRMRRNRILNLCHLGFSCAMHAMYLLGAGICGLGILRGTVSFGTLTAVLQLIGQLQSPFAGFSGCLSQWYSMLSSAERLMEAESFPGDEEIHRDTDARCLALYHGDFAGIRGEKLHFSYTDPTGDTTADVTIRDLNFEIRKGEFISLVGRSGCGKSTLLKLLLCLYRPDSGTIRILRDAPAEAEALTQGHRGLFAYVPQGNQLMSGTIRQILAFHDDAIMAQEDRLWDALQVACADEFVSRLPLGLDSPLGEHGSGLSEGQIQRLAVARAICSRRPILLLDEATSALDADTETRLLNNLRTMTDRTVLLITHRPQACMVCDRIFELVPQGKEALPQ